ncbi:apolipoprotein L3-like [Haliotis asinina]|uniref:apolipoprotein L3-like n=1 Tax=Haliotis asinina TaxID=109174 RepID=UPI0035322F1C
MSVPTETECQSEDCTSAERKLTEMTSSSDAEALSEVLISLIKKEAEEKRRVISTLSALADELDRHSFNTRIANLTFASTGIVATGLTVAGVIAAPFTFGASLGLTIGGVALGVTSAVGAVGTTVVGRIIQSKAFDEASDAREEYTDTTNMLLQISKVLNDDKELLQQVLKNMDFKADLNAAEVAKLTALGLAGVGGGAMRLAAVVSAIATRGVISATTRTVASVLKTGFLAAKIGGAVLSALTLPLDVYTIVRNSVDIHKMTPGEGATELRDAVKKLMKTDLSIDESQEKDLITLIKENRDLVAQFVCMICFQEQRDVVFLPCGHVVSCQVCYNVGGFTKCPVCNTVIERDIIPKKDPDSDISTYLQEVDFNDSREQVIQMNRKLKLQRRCMVCNMRESNVLFLPCNHIMACSDCSHTLSCCRVCDTPVHDKETIYAI